MTENQLRRRGIQNRSNLRGYAHPALIGNIITLRVRVYDSNNNPNPERQD